MVVVYGSGDEYILEHFVSNWECFSFSFFFGLSELC